MRNAEWINIVFFSFFIVVALLRPPQKVQRRNKAIAIGICGIGLILILQSFHQHIPPQASSIFRDWLPGLLMLFAYWQAGNLIRTPNQELQNRLINFDRKLLAYFHLFQNSQWIRNYLEFTYLLCYPLVPGGLAILYATEMAQYSDYYWLFVLPPTYLCHAMVPFFSTLPPWMLEEENLSKKQPSKIRSFNFWIIRQASIHANTFPSAHVTSSMAASLVLIRFLPTIGAVFLWISISIAVATVAGRYHYALDVITALLVMILFVFSQNYFQGVI